MITYDYKGKEGDLKQVTKTNWVMNMLNDDTYFMHGTAAPPSKVHKFGISPIYSNEFLVDKNGAKIGPGKMIFAFQSLPNGRGLHKRSPAVSRLWGQGHAYVFMAPRNTKYYSFRGHCGTGCEIAFPYIIESSDIKYYIPDSSDENLDWKNAKGIIMLAG